MKTFAVVQHAGGIVTNIVVGDDISVVESIVGQCVEVTDETGPAGTGYYWDGQVFTNPYGPEGE